MFAFLAYKRFVPRIMRLVWWSCIGLERYSTIKDLYFLSYYQIIRKTEGQTRGR